MARRRKHPEPQTDLISPAPVSSPPRAVSAPHSKETAARSAAGESPLAATASNGDADASSDPEVDAAAATPSPDSRTETPPEATPVNETGTPTGAASRTDRPSQEEVKASPPPPHRAPADSQSVGDSFRSLRDHDGLQTGHPVVIRRVDGRLTFGYVVLVTGEWFHFCPQERGMLPSQPNQINGWKPLA